MTEIGIGQEPPLTDDEGRHPNARRIVLDLIEEYGRHVGHADLLRESVDGLVGEDPAPGTFPGTYTAVSGSS
ncbi:mycothiol transferase [Nocardioides pyridinolyticus]